eukprot:2472638-Pleurochrysis_carterae.AAC.1
MARHRERVERVSGVGEQWLRVITFHSYRPPVRLKGRTRRPPCGVGGDKIALTSAKRHSVPEDSQSASTESSESLKLGTHLTSLSVIATSRPESSTAESGRSLMAVQRCGRPSMPATRSLHAVRTFTRSERWGWICHVHPLSTTNAALSVLQTVTAASSRVAAGARSEQDTRGCRNRGGEASLRRHRVVAARAFGGAGAMREYQERVAPSE